MRVRSPRNDSLDVVRHLVTVIGPRRATSLAEAQAAAYIDGRLRRAGMRVSADTFSAPTCLGLTYALLFLLGLSTAVLTFWMPFLAVPLALCGLGLAVGDALVGPIPLFAPHRDSQNIVGTQASEKQPRWRVVILAPLDSLPSSSGIHRFTGPRRLAVLSRMTVFLLLALLALLQQVEPGGMWKYGQLVLVACLLVTVLPFPQSSGASPGGAGALAVLLAAAERLNTLHVVELWAVALGATATGNSGLHNLLARYPFPKIETLLLALETIDQGHLTYASREGVLRQRPADSLLTRIVAAIDASDPTINAEPRPYNVAPSIADPLHRRGYRALTILTHSDALERDASGESALKQIDPQSIERATRLVVGIVQYLDSDQAGADDRPQAQDDRPLATDR